MDQGSRHSFCELNLTGPYLTVSVIPELMSCWAQRHWGKNSQNSEFCPQEYAHINTPQSNTEHVSVFN